MKPKKRIRKRYERREPIDDFMKYWRVVRKWALDKYGVTTGERDLMFYLYSQHLFTTQEFKDFDLTLNWDTRRFYRLRKEGWISRWRDETVSQQKALYELSFKGKRMVRTVYKKLLGEERISEEPTHNPAYQGSASYSQRRNKKMIEKMNEDYGN